MKCCRTKWDSWQKNSLPVFLADSTLLCTKTSFVDTKMRDDFLDT